MLIGAPGSGKGTQAARLAERFNIAHISSGDLLRQHVRDGTSLGRMVKKYVDAGDLVPDAVVMDMLYKPVVAAAAGGGYILDGFPRTVGQAEAAYDVVSELGAQVQVAIHLDVADDELVRRLLERSRGTEDTVDVIHHRLEVYREQTVPLLEYYRRRERLVTMDGSRSVDEVEASIVRELSWERHLAPRPSASPRTHTQAPRTANTFAAPAPTSGAGHPPVRYHLPDRNLGLDLMRATEAAALAAGRWAGLGEKERGDGAAVDAMRDVLRSVPMRGRVVIGEGEKDEAPMLHNGETVGDGTGPEIDIAVDPVDGTTLLAKGMPNAIAVIAAADRGSMYDPKDVFYMHKLVVGPAAAGRVDITAPVEETIRVVADANGGGNSDLTVAVLDRPRHAELIARIRATGARIKLFPDGDVAVSIAVARPGTGIDLLLGVGGSPEGVITACAMKAMGGEIQALLYVATDEDRRKALDAGHDLDRVLHLEDLVAGDNTFFVGTGITDGDLLDGVRYYAGGARTRSLVMRSRSGTVREVASDHAIDKVLKHSPRD